MDYDVGKAFQEIEDYLMDSMMRNFKHHRAEELKEGYNWTQWQAEQMKALEQYRKNNAKKFKQSFLDINDKVVEMIKLARESGNADQELAILEAIESGLIIDEMPSAEAVGEFFKINDKKLDALIKATTDDLEKAETAILRKADDEYRKAIFNAEVAANTGSLTYKQAIDMACRDMLRAGLNCVEYKNGARHTLSDYADMAVKTATKRAYLYGEGEKRQEWGLPPTVVVNNRQGGCPECARFIGKVFIDDVYSGGKKSDGNYPLLSFAIKLGLFHPRCKDSTSTYYEGITTLDPELSKWEIEDLEKIEQLEQQKTHSLNEAKKCQRIADHSLDSNNKRIYQKRADDWTEKADNIEEKLQETVANSADSGIINTDELTSELGTFKKRIIRDNDIDKNYYCIIKDRFSHGSDFAKKAFNKYVPDDSILEYDYPNVARYSTAKKKIFMNCEQDKHNSRGNGATWFHEHGHLIDDYAGGLSKSEVFGNILNDDYMQYMMDYGKKHNLKTFDKVQNAISDDLSSMREHSAVSDILHGLSKGNIQGVAKHDLIYWEQKGNLEAEAFAHMFECQFDEVRYREMKKYFPNALAEFEKILKGVL